MRKNWKNRPIRRALGLFLAAAVGASSPGGAVARCFAADGYQYADDGGAEWDAGAGDGVFYTDGWETAGESAPEVPADAGMDEGMDASAGLSFMTVPAEAFYGDNGAGLSAEAFWIQVYGGTEGTEYPAPDFTVEASGMFPDGVRAEAYSAPFPYAAEYGGLSEYGLGVLEIGLSDGEGYTLQEPVTVRIDGAAVRDAAAGGADILVYSFETDPETGEQVCTVYRDLSETDAHYAYMDAEYGDFFVAEDGDGLWMDGGVCLNLPSFPAQLLVTAAAPAAQDAGDMAEPDTADEEYVPGPDGMDDEFADGDGWAGDVADEYADGDGWGVPGSDGYGVADPEGGDTPGEGGPVFSDAEEPEGPVPASDAGDGAEAGAPGAETQAGEAQTLSYDAGGYSVEVECTEDAGVPSGAELEVTELAENARAGRQAKNRAAEAADIPEEEVQSVTLVRLAIRDGGGEVEPSAAIGVRMYVEGAGDDAETCVVSVSTDGAEVLPGAETGGGTAFETDAESMKPVYAIVTRTLRKVLAASDGATYEITVEYRDDAQIPEGAELEVSELSENAPGYEEYVSRAAEALGGDPGQFAFARAFDISITDPVTGARCQPSGPVSVSMELYTEDIREGDSIDVVHFPGSDAVNPPYSAGEVLDASLDGSAVAFESGGFSVYVVVENEPALSYRFLDADGAEYSDMRQTLRRGDVLVQPSAPSDGGRVFDHWTRVNAPEDAPDGEAFDSWGEVTEIPALPEGMKYPVIRYLKAVFKTAGPQVKVSWHDQGGSILHVERIGEGETVDPDIMPYTARQVRTGEYLVFQYWTEDPYAPEGEEPVRFEPKAADGDVDLYPYCAQYHWIYFDGNKRSGDGDVGRPESVPYTAPLLVTPGVVPGEDSTPLPGTPSTQGYAFLGWFTTPSDAPGAEGEKVFNADGTPVPEQFTAGKLYMGGTGLAYDPTLYARWQPSDTAGFSVAVYRQRAGDVYDEDGEGYHFDYQGMAVNAGSFAAKTGTSLRLEGDNVRFTQDGTNWETAYTVNLGALLSGDDVDGFELDRTRCTDVAVAPDGSSVFRIYLARKHYILVFKDYQWHGGGRAAVKTTDITDAQLEAVYSGGRKFDTVKTVHALYGQDISAEFPVMAANGSAIASKGYYLSTSNQFSTGGRTAVLTGNSWLDADGSSLGYSLFKRIDYVPAFKGGRTTEYFVHNSINASTHKLVYYLEVLDPDAVSAAGSPPDARYVRLDGKTFEMLGSALNYGGGGFSSKLFDGYNIDGFTQYKAVNGRTGAAITNDAGWNTANNNNDNAYLYYSRNSYTVTLRYMRDGRLNPAAETVRLDLPYETPVTQEMLDGYFGFSSVKALRKDAESGEDIWWFNDGDCNDPYSLKGAKVPNHDITLYKGMITTAPVQVDPDGGELDGSNGSTWFNVTNGELVSEYMAAREYAPVAEAGIDPSRLTTAYKYVFHPYGTYIGGKSARRAEYRELTGAELASIREDGTFTPDPDVDSTYYRKNSENKYDAYVYSPGVYSFQYWYAVTADFDPETGVFTPNEQPSDSRKAFNFSVPVSGPLYLKAKWVDSASYRVVYDAGEDAEAPVDGQVYADGSDVVVKAAVGHTAGGIFRFWSTEKPEDGQYATAKPAGEPDASTFDELHPGAPKLGPNDVLVLSRGLTADRGAERVVTLYAWYDKGAFNGEAATYCFYVQDENGVWHDGEDDIAYYVEVISPGERLITPDTPEDPAGASTGRSFTGWYLDKGRTRRFEGFGIVPSPRNLKLYAGFARTYTVDYMDKPFGESGQREITQQVYIEGERLNTGGISPVLTEDQYVVKWRTADEPAAFHPYDAKGGVFGTDIDTNLTLYPVLATVNVLYFDPQGGSYTAPMTFPKDRNQWLPMPKSERKGYAFKGWWTEKGYSGTAEGGERTDDGVMYGFDRPLDAWSEENGTDVPGTFYAHWERNGEPIYTDVNVNYWIENTDKNGYFLWDSELVSHLEVDSVYTLEAGYMSVDKIKGYYTFTADSEGDTDNANDDRRCFEYASVIYACEGGASGTGTTAAVVDGRGTSFNVYFDRKTYTLYFDPYWEHVVQNQHINYNAGPTGNYYYDFKKDVTYIYSGRIGGTAYNASNPYGFTVWLGKDISGEWPSVVDYTDNRCVYEYDAGYSSWGTWRYYDPYFSVYPDGDTSRPPLHRGKAEDNETRLRNFYSFNSWKCTELGYDSPAMQAAVGKNLIPADGSATFKADLKDSTVWVQNAIRVPKFDFSIKDKLEPGSTPGDPMEATVHYMVPETYESDGTTVEEWRELNDYRQIMYGITGTGSGNGWRPDNASLNRILAAKLAVSGYQYGGEWDGAELSGTVTRTLYKYRMPDSGEWGQYHFYHKYAGLGALIFKQLKVSQRSEWVERGDFDLVYDDAFVHNMPHRSSDPVFYADARIDPFFVNAFDSTGMSAMSLRDIITEGFYETTQRTVAVSGRHVYLYYIPQSYYLSLYSTETDSWSRENVLVPYGSFLTNEDGTQGYIRNVLRVTPPEVEGKAFLCWSLSDEAATPYEGSMPDRKMILYAHYGLKKYTVTTLGVKPGGALRRDDGNCILRDENGIPMSWNGTEGGSARDFSAARISGTRLAEFDLPRPALGESEVFYGWKRLVDDGSLSTGYITGSTLVKANITLVPVIEENRSGRVEYYANNTGDVSSETPVAEAGPFYAGAMTKAVPGTADGMADGEALIGRDGRTFVCWNTSMDGTGTNYYPGDNIALPEAGETTPLYAVYSMRREVSLVYDLNCRDEGRAFKRLSDGSVMTAAEGEGIGIVDADRLKVDFSEYDRTTNHTKSENPRFPNLHYPAGTTNDGTAFVPYRPGCTFLKWNTEPDGSGMDVFAADTVRVDKLPTANDDSFTLYAQWAEIVLPVTVYEAWYGDTENASVRRVVDPYEPFIEKRTDWSASAQYVGDTEYDVYTRNGLTHGEPGRTSYIYMKAYAGGADHTPGNEVTYVRFDQTENKWFYQTIDSGTAWLDFGVQGLSLYYFPEEVRPVVYYVIRNADGTLSEASPALYDIVVREPDTIRTTTEPEVWAATRDASVLDAAGRGLLVDTGFHLWGDSADAYLFQEFAVGPAVRTERYDRLEPGVKYTDLYALNTREGMRYNGRKEGLGTADPVTGARAVYVVYRGGTPICKIEKDGVEFPFETLKAAVAFAGAEMGGNAVIEMLTDYTVPSGDAPEIEAGSSITFTTAAESGKRFCYTGGNGGTAVLSRGFDGGSLFTADGELAFEDIVLDGARDVYSTGGNGGAAGVNAGGSLILGDGAVVRNFSAAKGGAVYTEGTVSILPGASLTGNTAEHGAAIFAANGAGVYMTGGTIRGNASDGGAAAADGAVLVFSGDAIVTGNTKANGKDAMNVYLAQDSNAIINMGADGLGEASEIGVYAAPAVYGTHGRDGMPFGSYAGQEAVNAGHFFNDISGSTGSTGAEPGTLYWAEYIARVSEDGENWRYFEYLAATVSGGESKTGAFDYADSLTGDVIVEPLYETHTRYTLNEGFTFDGPGLSSLTIRSTDDAGWNPDGFRTTLVKGFSGPSMITVADTVPSFMAEDLVFDGKGEDGAGAVNGGLFSLSAEKAVFRGCDLKDAQTGAADGGAVFYNGGGALEMYRCLFDRCRAGGNGGAVYLDTGTLYADGCEFRDFTAGGDGGAVYNNSRAMVPLEDGTEYSVMVKNSVFDGHAGSVGGTEANAANGGAVYNKRGDLRISGSRILDCTVGGGSSDGLGGAICEDNSDGALTDMDTVNLRDVVIDGHDDLPAEVANAANGGAVYTKPGTGLKKGGSMRMADCTILDCTASERGGALYSSSIRRSPFTSETKDEPTIHMLHTVINGHESLPDDVYNAKRGGAVLLANGTLEMEADSEGTTLIENCSALEYGGAVDSYGSGTQYKGTSLAGADGDYTVKLKNTEIRNCTAGAGGGGVNIKMILILHSTQFSGCSAGTVGGAISTYGGLNAGTAPTVIDMSVNEAGSPSSISGNTAGGAGAGIYLHEGSKLLLGGSPDFGTDGNTTGSKRQDIFVAGYIGNGAGGVPKTASSLIVDGALYPELSAEEAKGRIWVGAEKAVKAAGEDDEAFAARSEANHWDCLKQFAVFDDALLVKEDGEVNGVRFGVDGRDDAELLETVYAAFRNAVLDEEHYGAAGENPGHIYWDGPKGSREVILEKTVHGTDTPLEGAVFTISRKGKAITGTDISGTENASEFPSGGSGVYFIGELDYGVYVLYEKTVPAGYDGGKPYFYLVVDEYGAAVSEGYASREEASEEGGKESAKRKEENEQADGGEDPAGAPADGGAP